MNEGLKLKLHGAAVLELHPSIECRCLSVCPKWSTSVGSTAAGALWMRGYFKALGMLRFNFSSWGRWHLAAAKSFHEVWGTACVPIQTWSLFEVRTRRGRRGWTNSHSLHISHQTAFHTDSVVYVVIKHKKTYIHYIMSGSQFVQAASVNITSNKIQKKYITLLRRDKNHVSALWQIIKISSSGCIIR